MTAFVTNGGKRDTSYTPCALQPKGSAFTGDNKDFLRFKLGSHVMIPAFEEAVMGMKVRK